MFEGYFFHHSTIQEIVAIQHKMFIKVGAKVFGMIRTSKMSSSEKNWHYSQEPHKHKSLGLVTFSQYGRFLDIPHCHFTTPYCDRNQWEKNSWPQRFYLWTSHVLHTMWETLKKTGSLFLFSLSKGQILRAHFSEWPQESGEHILKNNLRQTWESQISSILSSPSTIELDSQWK